MTSSEFAYICKHPEIIAAQYVAPLEETARQFPYCQSAHILSAKYYEDLDETSVTAQYKLQIAALYCVDRAMLKSIMDRDPVQVLEARRGIKPAEKVKRAVKGKTSVILTEANPVIAKKKESRPLSQSNITGYDDVRVPEIILPNEKLLSGTRGEPIVLKAGTLPPSDSNYLPVAVSQPYGDALFTELYQNLKELGQRKKKVLSILDKLPLTTTKQATTKPTPVTSTATKSTDKMLAKEVDTPTKTPLPKEKVPKSVTPTKAKTVEPVTAKTKEVVPSKKTKSAKPKEVITPKPIAPKAKVDEVQALKSAPPQKDKKTKTVETATGKTANKPNTGIESTSFEDEADLLLQYLHNLHPEVENTETEASKKKETPSLEDQQKLIDSFLKDLPVIKPRDSKQIEPDAPVQDLSEASTQAPSFISENLARIYQRQGNKAKAKETFEKLMLKYPEKSGYFAAEILKLDE
jgi:hypothetical protein